MEDIVPGAFVCEYLGEVITKRLADIRGTYYDRLGCSYLFDMNDPLPEESYEMQLNAAANDGFFPFCIDGALYGNESRFINHSCEPNLRTYNLVTDCESQTYHSIGLFATRKIYAGDEFSIDYQWDKYPLDGISKDIDCLCGSRHCRGALMRAKKTGSKQEAMPAVKMSYDTESEQGEAEKMD